MRIYVIGSLRKPDVEDFADDLRAAGHDVFDMWRAAGPAADDEWRDYFKRHGQRYADAVSSPFVRHIVDFDVRWLQWAEAVIVRGAPGTSSGYELMWAAFQGKRPIIFLHEDPERWDAMALLIPGLEIYTDMEQLKGALDGDPVTIAN